MLISSSLCIISSALVTPFWPAAPRPYKKARPVRVDCAPRATAFKISWPERIPPSIQTSISLPTADAISGNMAIELSAPSSWRPPWLETISASAPDFAAIAASSASNIPLMISLPPHQSLIRATSSQSSCRSNCSPTQEESLVISDTPSTWPTILPKERRGVPSIPRHQRGRIAISTIFLKVSFGGVVSPFLISLWRCPRICRSRVSMRAEHSAALARFTSLLAKS